MLNKCNFPQIRALQNKVLKSQFVIGLDLHKRTTAIVVFENTAIDPKIIFQRKRLANADLLHTIEKFNGEKIVIAEAAFGWRMLEQAFQSIPSVTLIPVDARKTSAWAKMSGIKTDKVDAQILAYSCLQGGVPRLAVYKPNIYSQENFKLVNFRDLLVKQRTQIKNKLKNMNMEYGVNPYSLIQTVKSDLVKNIENLLLEQLQFFNEKIQTIESNMEEIAKTDPLVSLLRNIPGIGPITAFALRAKVDDISRFENKRHFASYFGLGIREHQSGNHFQKGCITKTGNRLIRKLLVQGAHVIKSHHPEYIHLYFPDLARRYPDLKKCPKLIIAVARKTLTFAYYSLTKKTPFSIKDYEKNRIQQSLMKKSDKKEDQIHVNNCPKAAELGSMVVS